MRMQLLLKSALLIPRQIIKVQFSNHMHKSPLNSLNHSLKVEANMVSLFFGPVIVLYGVDKAAEHIQHLIKWIMDCYSEACKLILCCENDAAVIESVKNRCKVIKVDAPVTHEVSITLILESPKCFCDYV